MKIGDEVWFFRHRKGDESGTKVLDSGVIIARMYGKIVIRAQRIVRRKLSEIAIKEKK